MCDKKLLLFTNPYKSNLMKNNVNNSCGKVWANEESKIFEDLLSFDFSNLWSISFLELEQILDDDKQWEFAKELTEE
jgi:hypothetical protein